MRSPLRYARALGNHNGVQLGYLPIKDIVEHTMSSNVLASNSTATYIGYTIVGKIMRKHQSMLPLLRKLEKNSLVGSTVGITHLSDSNLYIFAEKDVLLMILATEVLAKNKINSELPAEARFIDTPVLSLLSFCFTTCSQRRETFPTFCAAFSFHGSKNENNLSLEYVSIHKHHLFLSLRRKAQVDEANTECEKQKTKLLLKFERPFSLAGSSSSNQSVQMENILNNDSLGRSLQNTRDSNSGRDILVIKFDDLNIASPRKNRASTERFTTPSKKITSTEKKSLGASCLQERSKTIATGPFTMADVITGMTKKGKKTLKDTPCSPVAESRPLVH